MKRVYFSICLLLIVQIASADISDPYSLTKNFRNLLTTNQCNYQCGTCDSSTPSICLSCSTTSFRTLTGTNCVCQPTYLEVSEPNCAACPANCSVCSSVNTCTTCQANTYSYNGQCYQTSCPTNTYSIPSTYTCNDYLSYTIKQSRDSQNRIVLTFTFNYNLQTIANPTSLILMKIKEDTNGSIVSITALTSPAQNVLQYLILPRTSISSSTLLITSYSINQLVSSVSQIPIQQVDANNPISIQLGAYIQPSQANQQDNLRNASDFLYNQSKVSYTVFLVFKCLGLFVHIFPALQFIMALCLMECFRTPLYYYLIKFIGGFGINQLPDWQLQLGVNSVTKLGDQSICLLYYVIQLGVIYILFGISKWIYEIYKNQEVQHISQFERALKVHIWTITILQHIHSVLFFYLVYYSVFILIQADFSSGRAIFFFVLSLIVIVYIIAYLVIGAYRLTNNNFHLFICYVKDIEEQFFTTRFYLFGIGNARKLLFVILLCALYSANQIAICVIAVVIYFAASIYTIIVRPYETISLLVIKIIEELSMVGLFVTMLAGQIMYSNDGFILSNVSSYYTIDYICIAFLSVFIFMNIVRQFTYIKHIIWKSNKSKRTITYLHKYDDHYQDPISTSRNKPLIGNVLDMSNGAINRSNMFLNQQNKSPQKNNYQSQRMGNDSTYSNDKYDPGMIEMNNFKSVNTHQSQKKNQYNTNPRNSTEEKTKFQKAVNKARMENFAANQFLQNHQQHLEENNQGFQSNPITNIMNNKQKNMQPNPFVKTKNGFILQNNLRDLYGSSNNSNMLYNNSNNNSNHSSVHKNMTAQNYYAKKKNAPSISMIQEQKKIQSAADQIDRYFNRVYGNNNGEQSIQKQPSDFNSIEKKNFNSNQYQSNQQNGNTSYSFQNPYISNQQQKPNMNLDYISEEDFKNSLSQNNQSDIYQNPQQQRKQKTQKKVEINLGNEEEEDQNYYIDYNQNEEEYHEIDQNHYSQSPKKHKNENPNLVHYDNDNYPKITNEHEGDHYNGGESIDLSEYTGKEKEIQLKEYLKQTLKPKGGQEGENISAAPKQEEPQNQFQVFFEKKMNDNSVQYYQDEFNDQNNSNFPVNENKTTKSQASKKPGQNTIKELDNIGYDEQLPPQIDTYISPEFKKTTSQYSKSDQPVFKKAVKQTIKQNFDMNSKEE